MKKFAAFDIDGTLIRWQLYHAVVDELARQQLLGPDAQADLRAARMKWKNREHPEAFKTYEIELIAIYERALKRIDTRAFDKAVKKVIKEYQQQVYTYTRDLIKQLKHTGYVLLAISGSQQELVAAVAQVYGFDDCVGTIYARAGHHFTGHKQLGSKDKRRELEQLIKKHGLGLTGSVAVGDSASDISMLEMVEQPIAFNPDQVLLQTAQQQAWKIVVERKNVVYELEPGDGRYVLA